MVQSSIAFQYPILPASQHNATSPTHSIKASHCFHSIKASHCFQAHCLMLANNLQHDLIHNITMFLAQSTLYTLLHAALWRSLCQRAKSNDIAPQICYPQLLCSDAVSSPARSIGHQQNRPLSCTFSCPPRCSCCSPRSSRSSSNL